MNSAVLGALSAVDLAILTGSVVVVVIVGLVMSRRAEDTSEGYFLAGRSLSWWIIGASFVSTSVSSEQMVGTVGVTYEWGMAIGNWEWFCLCYIPLLIFFMPILLRNRITTVPEYYTRRFGPRCGDIYSWVMLTAYVLLFTVAVLYSGTLAFAEITGWNFYVVLWLMVFSVGIYTVIGGMTSVMWTTMLQCILLLGGGTVLFVIALNHVPGGWNEMVQANPERFHLYQPMNHPKAPFLGLVLGSFGVFLFYQVGNQFMVQRILTARTTWDGLMGLLFAGFINILRPLTTAFLGLIVYHWIHEMNRAEPLDNFDTAFPFALKTFAPEWGLRGFILAGFLAAVMSTLSSLINSTATIFSLDIYKKLFRKNATDAELVRSGKVAALLALVVSALVCPAVFYLGGIFSFFQTGVTYLATPFICTFMMGILWWRSNYASALFGMVGGIVIQIAIAVGLPMAGYDFHWFYIAFLAQVVIMAGMVVVSLVTAPPDYAAIESLVWKPSVLTAYDDGRKRPWYQQLKLWFALWALTFIGIYYYFW